MAIYFFLSIPEDPIGDVFGSVLWIFEWFNDISSVFFSALKYILFFLLILLSVLAFLKFKKSYTIFKSNQIEKSVEEKLVLKKKQFVIGIAYFLLALGFLFDFITYLMLIILEPLPDRFAFQLLNYAGVFKPWALHGLIDVSSFGSPIETTVFYFFTFISLICFLDILVSVWLIITENIVHIKKAFFCLFTGVFFGFLVGFTTFLPLLL